MNIKNRNIRNLIKDLVIILISIIFSIFLVKSGSLEMFLQATKEAKIIGSLLGGMFFTSAFTIAPASVALVHIGQSVSPYIVATFGAFGALIGDLIILFFIRDVFAEDLKAFVKKSKYKKFISLFHLRIWRWILPVAGAFIIASPIPDEIGLTLMGIPKIRKVFLLPLIYFMNYIGIIAILSITKTI